MHLHEHLHDLVARQGPSVVDTAEAFRAALDDFLTEDEATTGELNLLVDAVRLGAVDRLGSILDHGGSAPAAVSEAGDGFARDRGTDDLPRCRWAVAVVGYALGLLEEADVPPTGPQSIPILAPQTSPTTPPSPPPPRESERPAPPAPATAHTPRTFPSTEDLEPRPISVTPGPPRRGAARVALAALMVAAIAVAAVFAGMWLASRDDDPNASAGDPTGGDSGDGASGSPRGDPVPGALPAATILAPVTDEDDVTRIYAINSDTGEAAPLTSGPDDRSPAISPDRSTVVYSETTPGGAGRPMVLDVATGESRPLFATTGGCQYSGRPGFNPAGNRLAVVCVDEFGGYVAAYVVDLDGAFVANIPTSGEAQGTATWTSGNTVVFIQAGATEDDPTVLWQATIGEPEPEALTSGTEGWDSHPDWSEEAGLLLYSRHEGSRPFGDLLTMDAKGTPGPSAEGVLWGHPAWSPDGTQVVVMVREEDGGERFAVASIEGDGFAEPTLLPELPGDPGVPAWGSR